MTIPLAGALSPLVWKHTSFRDTTVPLNKAFDLWRTAADAPVTAGL
jgi:hypothetical protein